MSTEMEVTPADGNIALALIVWGIVVDTNIENFVPEELKQPVEGPTGWERSRRW